MQDLNNKDSQKAITEYTKVNNTIHQGRYNY